MAESWVELHNLALEVAGFFVVVSVSLSAYLILQHFTAFNKPEEQKWIVCCIFMVPAYSIDSWVTLKYPGSALIFNLLRDCYEAYTIYAFGSFLIECMGGEDKVIQKLEANVEKVPTSQTALLEAGYGGSRGPVVLYSRDELFYHPPPMCCLSPWRMGKQFYMGVKFGIVQYMILKVLCTLATWILSLAHVYGDGEFKWNRGYPYIATIINFSQMWALYCLLQFYLQSKEWLAHISPVGKFACIKAVIFVTWWQGLAIALLFNLEMTPSEVNVPLQNAIQAFLICIEMCIASVAHLYVFPATPYQRMSIIADASQVTLLTDVAAGDAPPSPTEVMESERAPYIPAEKSVTRFHESMQDALVGANRQVIEDVTTTVAQAVEPIEHFNAAVRDTLDVFGRWGPKRTDGVRDDSWLTGPGGEGERRPHYGKGSHSDGGRHGKARSYGSIETPDPHIDGQIWQNPGLSKLKIPKAKGFR
jgi:hypothetical protein